MKKILTILIAALTIGLLANFGVAQIIAEEQSPDTALTDQQKLLQTAQNAIKAGSSPTRQDYELTAQSGPDGVYVMVMTAALHPDAASKNDGWVGYHVYRRAESETDFVRLTKTPLSRPGSLIELEAKVGAPLEGIQNFIGLDSLDEYWELVVEDDERAKTLELFSPTLSQALGRLYIDRNVEKNVVYNYYLTRVNKKGEQSPPSREVGVVFGTPTAPLHGPVAVSAVPGHRSAALSWLPYPADSAAIGYRVYRSISDTGPLEDITIKVIPLINDAPWVQSAEIDTLMVQDSAFVPHGEFSDFDVLVGRTYYYSVVAVDYLGNESSWDTLVEVTIADLQAPRNPQNVFARSDRLGVRIDWEPMVTEDSEGGEDDVAGYRIYRSSNPDSLFALVSDSLTPRNSVFWIDREAQLTDEFFYRVTAIDQSGNESEKSAKAFSVHDDTHSPEAPMIDSAIGEIGKVRLHWSPIEDARLSGYLIFRAHKYNGDLTQISDLIPADSLVYIDSDDLLSSAGTYWYFTQSMTIGGRTGEYSIPTTGSPLKISGPPVPMSLDGYQDSRGNRLSWRAPMNVAVMGYNVYRAKFGVPGEWLKVNTKQIEGILTWYTDTSAEFGVTYEYTVRALDFTGAESDNSRTLELKRFNAIAGPPADLRVTQDNGALSLHWSTIFMPALKSYNIYRRSEGNAAERIAQLNANDQPESFTDLGLSAGARYYYSITVVTNDGRESSRSEEVSYFLR